MEKKDFLLQISKFDYSLNNIAIFDENNEIYYTDSGIIDKNFETDNFEYKQMSFGDMRLLLYSMKLKEKFKELHI